jgi:flagellin
MAFRINTNVSAMGALRNLNQTGTEFAKSTTRLSTGLRIVTAADDPSGLIASESYRAQLGSMDAALRNNQDAMNYAKTAEGGLEEVSRLLRDARSLAVANGSSTLDSTQKQANQTQLNNIMQSIDRISNTTQYGTVKLLDGSAGTVGTVTNAAAVKSVNFTGSFDGASMTANGSANVQVTTAATQASINGSKTTYTAATNTVGAGAFSINGASFETSASTTVAETVTKINEKSGQTGVVASFDSTNNRIALRSESYGSDAKINLTDSGSIIQSAAGAANAAGTNAVASVTYDSKTVTFDQGKGLDLKDTAGNSIKLTVGGNTATTHTAAVQVSAGKTTFQTGANAGQTATLSIGNFSSSNLGVSSLDISGTDMSDALSKIDSAIGTVSESRGRIGSFVRNTLESNVRSLSVSRENLSATESAVREVDVAEEMTNYTKLQILQQSSMSMLAQANSAPQSVLSLIR